MAPFLRYNVFDYKTYLKGEPHDTSTFYLKTRRNPKIN